MANLLATSCLFTEQHYHHLESCFWQPGKFKGHHDLIWNVVWDINLCQIRLIQAETLVCVVGQYQYSCQY